MKKKSRKSHKPIRQMLPYIICSERKNTYLITVVMRKGDTFGILVPRFYFENDRKQSFKGVLNNKKRGSKKRSITGKIIPGRSLVELILTKRFCEAHGIVR